MLDIKQRTDVSLGARGGITTKELNPPEGTRGEKQFAKRGAQQEKGVARYLIRGSGPALIKGEGKGHQLRCSTKKKCKKNLYTRLKKSRRNDLGGGSV